MGRRLRRLAVVVLLLVTPAFALGDYVLLKDGRVIRGRLVSKSSNEVVIQVRKGNADLTVRYPLADVASVGVDPPAADPPQAMRKPAAAAPAPATQPSGPTYLVAPIRGQVGLYVTAPLVKTYIAIARAEKPTC